MGCAAGVVRCPAGLPPLPAASADTHACSPQLPALPAARPAPSTHACPQIILHPKWGSSVYPASLFAKAPLPAVQQAIAEAVAALKDSL